jgi:hypothetical protein
VRTKVAMKRTERLFDFTSNVLCWNTVLLLYFQCVSLLHQTTCFKKDCW